MLTIPIRGIEPLVVHRFDQKAKLMMKMAEGSSAANKKNREARDYDAEATSKRHISTEGWDGICASAFRAAAISACRLVNFKMTMAKLSIFIIADGYDKEEGSPLVRIYGSEPETYTAPTRNSNGVVDIRSRPLYEKWACLLKVRYDADQFKETDIFNLFTRVGLQVGVGEGRPDSKASAGLGIGIFETVPAEEVDSFYKAFKIAA
jgi:hypothetical protein